LRASDTPTHSFHIIPHHTTPTQPNPTPKTNPNQSPNSCRLGSVFSMIAQARRVATELSADAGGAAEVDVRRRWPYGHQFANDWVTRLEVAHGAAAGVQYVSG